MKFSKIFEPGKIGNMDIRNRIVMPPMGTNLADEKGAVTPSMVEYYRQRAKGGAGLIIVEVTCVDPAEGKAISKQVCLHDNVLIAGHSELAESVQAFGAKIIPQLHHAGRQTTVENTGGRQPVGPSAVTEPFLNVVPRELSISEIEDIRDRFISAALRAKIAGYDGVEIHGAHGYLIGQFMSPFSNKRNDIYGGDLSRRMKFPLDIIEGIKKECGHDFPVVFRLSAEEFVEGGIRLEEAKQIAKRLEDAGVDALDVSSGIYASIPTILEPMKYEEGWRIYLAEAIKKDVSIPVIGVGVVRSPETAEEIISSGRSDFVALGRTLISDPQWPLKVYEGRTEDIRKCISCNIGCIGERVFANKNIRCTVNPLNGREYQYPYIRKVNSPKNITIVGGGPAGMEAARTLSMAGHSVTLFEKEGELGGQVKLAAELYSKEKITWSIEYLERQIRQQGVEIHENTQADIETIHGTNPDTVILATGAAPLIPEIHGIDGPNVVNAWDLLAGKSEVGNTVVIIGGGDVGCETALTLKHRRTKEVTVLEMQDELAVESEPISRIQLLMDIESSGVKALTGINARHIKSDGVSAIDKNFKEHFFPCKHVVIAAGSVPVNDLEVKLREKGMNVFVVGDAKEPRKLDSAINEGFLAAQRILEGELTGIGYI